MSLVCESVWRAFWALVDNFLEGLAVRSRAFFANSADLFEVSDVCMCVLMCQRVRRCVCV